MRIAVIGMLYILGGCTYMSTPPKNGCGIRFTSWCVSEYASPKILPVNNQSDIRISIDVDGSIAVISFPKICSTGSFSRFHLFRGFLPANSHSASEMALGWTSEGKECSILLDKGKLGDSEYDILARNVHYYLIELGAGVTLSTFPY